MESRKDFDWGKILFKAPTKKYFAKLSIHLKLTTVN